MRLRELYFFWVGVGYYNFFIINLLILQKICQKILIHEIRKPFIVKQEFYKIISKIHAVNDSENNLISI